MLFFTAAIQVTATDLMFRKFFEFWWFDKTSCWNGCDVVLKVVIVVFIRGIF